MTALKAGHNCDFHSEVAVMTRPCVGHICDQFLGRRYVQVAVMLAEGRVGGGGLTIVEVVMVKIFSAKKQTVILR